MHETLSARSWTRHFVYRTEHARTTWKFRFGFVLVVLIAAWLTREWWTVAIARSLVCESKIVPSDAILVENFDQDYLVFARATQIRRAGFAPRVVVPVRVDSDSLRPNSVALGTVELMASIAHLGTFEIAPMREVEPISLNAAYDILDFLERQQIRSVIVVSPLFRSRRSALVYGATLGRAGIALKCDPIQGTRGVETWTKSWHGIQEVTEQWLKLQYYRLYVVPFKIRANAASDSLYTPR